MTHKQRRLLKTVRFKKGLVGGIYCWKNMVNGKELIGQTKHFPTRKKQYKQKGGNHLFKQDVKKYCWSNFKVFCLNTATNPDIRNRLETFYIIRRNSLTPNGYNQNTGGDAHNHTEEYKRRMQIMAKEKGWTKEKEIRVCEYCGKEYEVKNKKQRFCSWECGMKSHKGNPDFIKALTDANRRTGQREDIRKQRSEDVKKRWQDPEWREMMKGKVGSPRIKREVRLCARCGNTFLARPKEYKKKCDECIKKSKE